MLGSSYLVSMFSINLFTLFYWCGDGVHRVMRLFEKNVYFHNAGCTFFEITEHISSWSNNQICFLHCVSWLLQWHSIIECDIPDITNAIIRYIYSMDVISYDMQWKQANRTRAICRQTCNISSTMADNLIVDNSEVIGTAPTGHALTTS